MTMLGRFPRKTLLKTIFILAFANGIEVSIASVAPCQQINMRPWRMGQRCMTDAEVYRNHTDVPQERCMWHCLRDLSCKVIDYNLVGSYCLLGHGPCASLQPDNDFVTTPMTMKMPCMTWVHQDAVPPTDTINVYSFHIKPDQTAMIGRAIVSSERIPGRYQPVSRGGFYSLDGRFIWFSAGEYELLAVSSRYNITWVSYNSLSGNSLPRESVIGGSRNGDLLYVARYLNENNAYVTGYYSARDRELQVAHSGGVSTSTVMELLVVSG